MEVGMAVLCLGRQWLGGNGMHLPGRLVADTWA